MPVFTLVAGPNGSGKSTLTQWGAFEGRERLLDPDAVARALNPTDPASAALAAGREVLQRIEEYFDGRASFAIETTLSGRNWQDWIGRAKVQGYTVHLIFVALDDPERNIYRIGNRVARGGHFIADEIVRRRHARSIGNGLEAIGMVDAAKFYDNSGDRARLVLVAKGGEVVWRAKVLPEWVKL